MPVRLLAGASGFAYKPWKGPFYPADLPDAEMLAFYAARLPTVEINNTFYRLPKASVLEGWAEQTPESFRFVLKASRRITHIQRLKDVADLVDYLFTTAASLGDKLGPLLFQLPPHMKKDLDRLRVFLDLVPKGRRVALEFRNATWFEDDVFDLLRAHDAALCLAETEAAKTEAAETETVETEGDRTEASETEAAETKAKATEAAGNEIQPLVATASWGYLRLRRDDYADADLTAWATRIAAQPWSDAYVFFKHEDEGAAPKLALRLMALAGR